MNDRNGEQILLQSRWRENDPRIDRVVVVVGFLERYGKVQIKTVLPDGELAMKTTFADATRFGSKARGKYSRVTSNEEDTCR